MTGRPKPGASLPNGSNARVGGRIPAAEIRRAIAKERNRLEMQSS
jgi:hypothetical protein